MTRKRRYEIVFIFTLGFIGIIFIFSVLWFSHLQYSPPTQNSQPVYMPLPPLILTQTSKNRYPSNMDVVVTYPEYPTPTPTEPLSFSKLQTYHDEKLAFSFQYPFNSYIIDQAGEGENPEVPPFTRLVHNNNLDSIDIILYVNPNRLTARQWFESEEREYYKNNGRSMYGPVTEIGEKAIDGGGSVYVLGRAHQCALGAGITVFISRNDKLYIFNQYNFNKITYKVIGLDVLLSTLRFDDSPNLKLSIPDNWMEFPSSKDEGSCEPLSSH